MSARISVRRKLIMRRIASVESAMHEEGDGSGVPFGAITNVGHNYIFDGSGTPFGAISIQAITIYLTGQVPRLEP